MIGSLISGTSAALGRRNYVAVFLPVLGSMGLILAVILDVRQGLAPAVNAWAHQKAEIKALQILGFLVVAWIVTILISGGTATVQALLEGRWGRVGAIPARYGAHWHRRRLAMLAERSANGDSLAYDVIHGTYPLPTQPDLVMPTRLGNVTRNPLLYAGDRYGLDPVLVWPRLFPLLPDSSTESYAASRAALERNAVLSVITAVTAFFCAGYSMFGGGSRQLYLSCLWGGAVISWLAYRNCVSSARVYALQIKVTFDLHRTLVLAAIWDDSLPDLEEAEKWQRLADLWLRAIPLDAARAAPEKPGGRRARASAPGSAAAAAPGGTAVRTGKERLRIFQDAARIPPAAVVAAIVVLAGVAGVWLPG